MVRTGNLRWCGGGRVALLVSAALVMGACSAEQATSDAGRFSNGLDTSVAGLGSGHGRLAGHVGPGRPGVDGPIPAMTLGFSNGATTVEATVHDGVYSVDLPAGRWEVHGDAGNVCATGLSVAPGGWQSADLIWPNGSCQDLGGPPEGPKPPPGPVPPGG